MRAGVRSLFCRRFLVRAGAGGFARKIGFPVLSRKSCTKNSGAGVKWLQGIGWTMATAAAIDRVVHHSVILEFDVAQLQDRSGSTTKSGPEADPARIIDGIPAKVVDVKQQGCAPAPPSHHTQVLTCPPGASLLANQKGRGLNPGPLLWVTSFIPGPPLRYQRGRGFFVVRVLGTCRYKRRRRLARADCSAWVRRSSEDRTPR